MWSALGTACVQVATKVVKAEIVNHPRHDPTVAAPPRKEKNCVIQ